MNFNNNFIFAGYIYTWSGIKNGYAILSFRDRRMMNNFLAYRFFLIQMTPHPPLLLTDLLMNQNICLRMANPPLACPMVCRDNCLSVWSVREVARCGYYVDGKRVSCRNQVNQSDSMTMNIF